MNIYLLNATINGKLLTEILLNKLDIAGIIGLDDSGRDKTNEFYDYTDLCEKNRVPYIRLKTYNISDSDDIAILEGLDIDLIIVASWQRLLPEWLINKCSVGVIGAHGSHAGISMGRGRSPQNWALLLGERQFIFSIFWIEPGTDNGAVIDTCEFEYSPTDTIMTSYVKLNLHKAEMIIKNLENGRIGLHAGDAQPSEGRYLPQRIKADGQIDWYRSAEQIYNMIRALTRPYPGAFTVYQEKEYVIWGASPVEAGVMDLYSSYAPGTVLSVLGEDYLVKCGSGLLLITDISGTGTINEGMLFESADFNSQMQDIVKRHREKYDTPLSDLILDEIKD